MTLNTEIAVRLPAEHNVQPREVLDKLIEALITAGGPWEPDRDPGNILNTNPEYDPPTSRMPVVKGGDSEGERQRLGTAIGQGFHGITDISYRTDGAPLHPKDVTHREEYPEDYEDGEESEYGNSLAYPACTYLLSVDTAYGATYTEADGALPGVTGCTSLHAAAIGIFNTWVAEQGGTVLWENEYRGTWHDMDDAEGWAQFTGSDREAQAWFKGTVLPAITAEILSKS